MIGIVFGATCANTRKGNAMKYSLALFSTIFLSLVVNPVVFAQTPDGEVPASEGVCDDLKAEGITKGLYGLCVAFCEAQDHATLSEPVTEQELDALSASAPAGRILTNYIKKMNESDPPMPCIRVQEPCPCWTEQEFLDTSQSAFDATSSLSNSNVCDDDWLGLGGLYYMVGREGAAQNLVFAYEQKRSGAQPICEIRRNLGISGGFRRVLRTSQEEYVGCRDRTIARQNEFGLIPSPTNSEGHLGYCLNRP